MTITIPPEALEKATDAVHEFFHNTHSRRFSRELARAACLAMLKAWPGMIHDKSNWAGSPILFLPLTENGNE